MTLPELLRRKWEQRNELLTPRVPDDAPAFVRGLIEQQADGRIGLAASIDAEIDDLLTTARELGVFEARRP